MTFARKLNFLMTITKTSNSALAARVSLDASYISRLRSGKRHIPKDEGVIQSMAASLTRRCAEEYQRKAVSDALKLSSMPIDNAVLTKEIADWLMHDNLGGAEQVGRFLSGLSALDSRPAVTRSREDCQSLFPNETVSVYYGVEGKRQASEYFLSEVASQEKPQTLLLFSDEETSWMTGDQKYARKWGELMIRILSTGNKVKIIHTISRDLDEMLNAISHWMPLYMSGNIEPYFYPKKRDGVFKRTLFIAPETAAVVSNSIGDQIKLAANILYRDRAVVDSFAEEFRQYLRLCRPLMRIFTSRDRDTFYDTLEEFERERADTLIMTESLSMLTMPGHLFASILKRNGMDGSNDLSVHETRRKRFLGGLQESNFTEIIYLPAIEAVKSGTVKVSLSEMLGRAAYYTPEEFSDHLKHIAALLDSHEHYRVHLISKPTEARYTVYAKEELGVIVAKTTQPPVVMAMSESNIIAAFWDFLTDVIGEKTYTSSDKKETIEALRKYLIMLQE